MKDDISIAKPIAAEDIRPGMYVAVLNRVVECTVVACSGDITGARLEKQSILRFPMDESVPLHVRAVCLPLVFVQEASGRCHTVDVRQYRLVRLNKRYAKKAFSMLKKQVTEHPDWIDHLYF